MADIFISLRFSEAKDKAILLASALRKRGINSVTADPATRWDRHADPTRQVTRQINEADLVVVIATQNYGKPMSIGFGSREEVALTKKYSKPFFLIKSCDKITVPAVLDFELRQPQCFSWFLGEPGEPQLPGGLVDDICDMLDEVRGLHDNHDDDDDEDNNDGASTVEATLSKGASSRGSSLLARRARGSVASEKGGGGKAQAEQTNRAAAEDALRSAALAAVTPETGALDFLSFAPDAMVAKGLQSLMAHLDSEEAKRAEAAKRRAEEEEAAKKQAEGKVAPSKDEQNDNKKTAKKSRKKSCAKSTRSRPGSSSGNAALAESKSGRDTPNEGTASSAAEAMAAADAAAAAEVPPAVDHGAEAVSWFRLAAEAHASRDAALLMADCAYGSVPTASAPQAPQAASAAGNDGGGGSGSVAGLRGGGAGAGGGGGCIVNGGSSSVGSGPKKGTTAAAAAVPTTTPTVAAAAPVGRDDDSAVRWLKAALRMAEGHGNNEEDAKKAKKKRNKHHKNAKKKKNLLLTSEDASTVGQGSMFDDSNESVPSDNSLESSSQPNGPAFSLSALGYGGEGEGFTSGLVTLEALTNLGECYYHGEGVRRDRPEAARLYRLAASRGYAAAQANLAEMLLSGDGIAKNESEASAWYAAAAQQDFTDGMLGLGGCYERGEVPSDSPDDVSEPNLALASFWYEAAAVKGSKRALDALERLEAQHLQRMK